MASGAMPPAFPPVEIDGEPYWDGGILSNTPLQYVLDARPKDKLLVFQVDLFSAALANTSKAVRDLLLKLPKRLKDDPAVLQLTEAMRDAPTDIVHLIYRKAPYELESKDYEFSRASVLEHWQAGQLDLRDTVAHPEWLKSSGLDDGVTQYDLTRHSRRLDRSTERAEELPEMKGE
jgi:NTE family protein